MKKLILAIVAVFIFSGMASVVSAQDKQQKKQEKQIVKDLKSKPIKEARKEAKRLKKEGWYVLPGSPSLDMTLEKAWIKQLEQNDDGTQKYIYADGNSVAGSQSAAQMAAVNAAVLQLATQISSRVASLINTNIANDQSSTIEANTVNETVMSAKTIVAEKLGRIDPMFKIVRDHETYKELKKGMVEMQVRLFYDKEQAELKAKEAIKDELRKKTNATEEELKKLMGM